MQIPALLAIRLSLCLSILLLASSRTVFSISLHAEPLLHSASNGDVLCALYNSTGGSNWYNQTGWCSCDGSCDPLDYCQFHGVTCDNRNRVTSMYDNLF